MALVALAFVALSLATGEGSRAAVLHAADRDCSDFSTQADAQDYYLDNGGPSSDPDRLDADNDGVACESNPCPCNHSTDKGAGGSDPEEEKRPSVVHARITSVVDGDTVKVRARTGHNRKYTVRLLGIDTPETDKPGVSVECGGPQATRNMRSLAISNGEGRKVRVTTDTSQDKKDRYGRLLAYVETRTEQLNVSQVNDGWAKVYVYEKRFKQYSRFKKGSVAREERRAGRVGPMRGRLP
jgi:endonuclease YncB( thermonuclease family)